MTNWRLSLVSPLFLVLVLGCNKGNVNAPASVKGKVTYNDKLVTAGTVTFHPSEGGPVPCIIKPDGTYIGTDLTTGDMVVTIETESANKDMKMPDYGGQQGRPGQGNPPRIRPGQGDSPLQRLIPEGAGQASEFVKIPKKYGDKKLSDLKVTISKGENKNDFDLKD